MNCLYCDKPFKKLSHDSYSQPFKCDCLYSTYKQQNYISGYFHFNSLHSFDYYPINNVLYIFDLKDKSEYIFKINIPIHNLTKLYLINLIKTQIL